MKNTGQSIKSSLWFELTTHPSNLAFAEIITAGDSKWTVSFVGDKIKAVSHRTYDIPTDHNHDGEREILRIIHTAAGHVRNLSYFALGHDVKWGLRGGYDGVVYNESQDTFPSIHQRVTNTYNDDHIRDARKIIRSLGSIRKRGVRTMLGYWRRGKEQDELGYQPESYLNFHKVLECLVALSDSSTTSTAILNRFWPGEQPLKYLLRLYRPKDKLELNELHRAFSFASKALATAGYDEKVKRGMFRLVVDSRFYRNKWNVAHWLVRPATHDEYDAIGQHSDDFDLLTIEGIYLEHVTKYFILNYAKPGQFKLTNDHGLPLAKPV